MAGSRSKEISFQATKSSGKVSALLMRPKNARWLLVLGHGAGAGMRHKFMEASVGRLANNEIATFRYQFPYMERGTKRPDPRPILLTTVRSAVDAAIEATGELPLLAGGKSMGGRMTSMAAAESPLPNVQGLVFFGFPLHPPGQTSTERSDHLANVTVPMLFLQGTRDSLANLDLLQPICKKLGKLARLHVINSADHSFHVLKSSGRTDDQVMEELGKTVSMWASRLVRD
jgi:predicted alpha/beta-hydrolase family hydrolase